MVDVGLFPESKKVFKKMTSIKNTLRLSKIWNSYCQECRIKISNFSIANQFKPIPYKELLCQSCIDKTLPIWEKINKDLEKVM